MSKKPLHPDLLKLQRRFWRDRLLGLALIAASAAWGWFIRSPSRQSLNVPTGAIAIAFGVMLLGLGLGCLVHGVRILPLLTQTYQRGERYSGTLYLQIERWTDSNDYIAVVHENQDSVWRLVLYSPTWDCATLENRDTPIQLYRHPDYTYPLILETPQGLLFVKRDDRRASGE